MSKKIGGGGDGIVLDVKRGKGGFMKRVEDGEGVGEGMVGMGNEVGGERMGMI